MKSALFFRFLCLFYNCSGRDEQSGIGVSVQVSSVWLLT